jgi:hypothetical protein
MNSTFLFKILVFPLPVVDTDHVVLTRRPSHSEPRISYHRHRPVLPFTSTMRSSVCKVPVPGIHNPNMGPVRAAAIFIKPLGWHSSAVRRVCFDAHSPVRSHGMLLPCSTSH